MCRMMAIVGRAPDAEALEDFRALAANGNVLPGNTCGHGDGWGVAAYRQGTPVFFEKSALSATDDPMFEAVAAQLAHAAPDLVICHARKASQGGVNKVNAHPFQRGKYAFCHNGGIRHSEEISTYGIAPTGETDSERFFLNIVGRLERGEAASLREAAEQSIDFVHERLPYSSISFLLTDGRQILAYRDYRTDLRPDETAPPKNFEVFPDYYTLYASETANAVSSQPLPVLANDWQLMENKEILVMETR